MVHDSHVRHRDAGRLASGNGTEIIEICDDEPSFDDFDDGPSIGSTENCYYEEVTGDTKASSSTVNIADWQLQTADKIGASIPLGPQRQLLANRRRTQPKLAG